MVGWGRELGKCKWENSWVERESKSCTRKQSKTRDYFTISHAQGSVQPFPAKQGSIPLSDSGRQTPLLRFFQSPISQACWDKLAAKPACMASWHHQRHKQWVSAGDLYSEDHVLWYFRGTHGWFSFFIKNWDMNFSIWKLFKNFLNETFLHHFDPACSLPTLTRLWFWQHP